MMDDAVRGAGPDDPTERSWNAEAGPHRLKDRIDPRLLPPEALIDSILNREPALDENLATWASSKDDRSLP